MIRPTRFLAAVALAALLPAMPAPAQAPVADVVVNMRDVEIADVAEQISRITGRTLILDPSVKGRVNVTSAEPLSIGGVWELFQSVLRVQGFAAVRSGRSWRIIPQANAIRDGGSSGVRGTAGAQDVVTRLIRLRNLQPEAAVRVFRPLVASFGTIEAITNPDAVVVTDYAENVRRIERLAASLDSGGGTNFDSITLRNGSARDVATAIQAVMGDGGAKVVADERSNIVLVRGDASSLAEARRMARLLDQPGGATPITRVFRLTNGDAESITLVLRGLLGDGAGAADNPVARSLAGSSIGAGGLGGGSNLGGGIGPSLSAAGGSALAAAAGGGSGGGLGSLLGASGSIGAGAGGQRPAVQGFSTPDLAVQPAPEINAIVVRGTPAAIASLEPLITDLDVRRPQVLIEAAIVEITGDQAEALGIQLGVGAAAITGADGLSNSATTLGLPLSAILSVVNPVAAAGVLANGLSGNVGIGNNFNILVQALGTSTRANLLSTPSVTTLDNEVAQIVVGQNVPFRTGSFATDGNSTNPFTTIERQDVGITLRVIPRILQGNVVRLEVSQEVSSLVGAVSGAADLITNRRAIQTKVLADNGGTIVLGGLITDDRQNSRSQVPVLGDVPVLGNLFKSRSTSRTKRTLFVFLKPTILRDKASADTATDRQYARLRGEEANIELRRRPGDSPLLRPTGPRLTTEINGLY
ncbi:type II secretion system secretin GspD [Sphingomonas montana]|uniref:type II secretion system secretin GspD n=1 Tax=Sphingomonas montana TaxID=1843236 RepID=UPI00096C754B|nr:type II secretion system secretin GspD [Sphingomonas montana]